MARRPEGSGRRDAAGHYAYERLDRVLHEKARLGILTALITRPAGLPFIELKGLCALTDGNLSRHLQVLADAGLIEMRKSQRRGRTQTIVRLSRAGRVQFLDYLDELERVLRDARSQPVREGGELETPPGWVPA